VLKSAIDEALQKTPHDGSGRDKVLQYYKSGMDLDAIDQAGLAPLKPHLERIGAIQGPGDLPPVLAGPQSQGVNAPMQFTIVQNLKDATRYVPQLAQGGLGLPDRDAYFREDARSAEVREAYRRHATRLLTLAGDAPEAVPAEVDTIVAFE